MDIAEAFEAYARAAYDCEHNTDPLIADYESKLKEMRARRASAVEKQRAADKVIAGSLSSDAYGKFKSNHPSIKPLPVRVEDIVATVKVYVDGVKR